MSTGPTLKLASTIPKGADIVGEFVRGTDDLSPHHRRLAHVEGFEAKSGQCLVVAQEDGPPKVLVGLDAENPSIDAVRRAGAAFARSVKRDEHAAFAFGGDPATERVAAFAEGAGLASYRYTALKGSGTTEKPTLSRITLVAKGPGMAKAFASAVAVVDAVGLARDLINEPGGSLLPTEFVSAAEKAVAKSERLTLTAWDEKRIAKEKLGGLLAVNKGSTHPPRLLKIEYKPSKSSAGAKHVALVGKGITFDSGGLSIKSGQGMMAMKIDMAGGAAVVAAMCMLETLGCKNRVSAWVPLTDNMPAGDATRPGDVFTARNGKTVEVLNTDAEGRLVLADALALAAETEPDAILDIATLTGSVTAALGARYFGVMGTDDALVAKVIDAAEATGEKAWHLPLPKEYRRDLDSDVADLRNIGKGSYGGALIAGLFLAEFVGDTPWAHLDLGLAAMSDADEDLLTKGGTGTGARTLARLASDL